MLVSDHDEHIDSAPLCLDDDLIHRIHKPVMAPDRMGGHYPLWRLLPHHPKQ